MSTCTGDESYSVKKETKVNLVQYTSTMVAHFICVIFTGFVIYTAQPGSSLFSWHPTLMVLAFAFLMAQGIMVFSRESSLLRNYAHVVKVNTHTVLMVLSLLCGLLGAFVIWYNKELNGKPHMTSWHGIVGYVTLGYVLVQCCAGVFVKYHHLLARILKPVQLKLYHATSGLLLYSLAAASLILGMFSAWFSSSITGTSFWACLVCPPLLVLVTMNQITQRYLTPKTR